MHSAAVVPEGTLYLARRGDRSIGPAGQRRTRLPRQARRHDAAAPRRLDAGAPSRRRRRRRWRRFVDRATGEAVVAYLEMQAAPVAAARGRARRYRASASGSPVARRPPRRCRCAPAAGRWRARCCRLAALPPGAYVARAEIDADGAPAGGVDAAVYDRRIASAGRSSTRNVGSLVGSDTIPACPPAFAIVSPLHDAPSLRSLRRFSLSSLPPRAGWRAGERRRRARPEGARHSRSRDRARYARRHRSRRTSRGRRTTRSGSTRRSTCRR